jgi:hypothetical protein
LTSPLTFLPKKRLGAISILKIQVEKFLINDIGRLRISDKKLFWFNLKSTMILKKISIII